MTETLQPQSPEELRPLLFSIAYRMVGSVSEAEDIVQEAFLRHQGAIADGVRIEHLKAYLSAVTTRLAIDHLRSARVRREQYVGPWLPEPLVSDERDPSEAAELSDSLSLAFLVLLERLTPLERAAFLLREVFGYPYERIAEVIERSEDNVRQLVSRARRHVEDERPRFDVSREAHSEITDRFLAACRTGDTEGLIALLAADVVAYTDGGGKAQAARIPIGGRDRVARFLVAVARPERSPADVAFDHVDVNGRPGVLMRDGAGTPLAVLSLNLSDGLVQDVHVVSNPDKLRHLRR